MQLAVMKDGILGYTEDGEEVPSLGEGWIVLDERGEPRDEEYADTLAVIAEVVGLANELEEVDGGQECWDRATKAVPYFAGLAGGVPPLYDPTRFDELKHFEVFTTLEQGDRPGSTFPDHWVHLDEDEVDEVLAAFGEMAILLREFFALKDLP